MRVRKSMGDIDDTEFITFVDKNCMTGIPIGPPINTLQDIVDIFLTELKKVLELNNFEVLLDKLKYGNSWHIHTHTLEQILIGNSNSVYYVCNHCK